MSKGNDDQLYIPGLEPEEEFDEFHEGSPSTTKKYFDASMLPDAPVHQRNADGSKTYVLYVVLPSWEHLHEALNILTMGDRKGLAKTAALATISGIAIKKGTEKTLFEIWKEKLL